MPAGMGAGMGAGIAQGIAQGMAPVAQEMAPGAQGPALQPGMKASEGPHGRRLISPQDTTQFEGIVNSLASIREKLTVAREVHRKNSELHGYLEVANDRIAQLEEQNTNLQGNVMALQEQVAAWQQAAEENLEDRHKSDSMHGDFLLDMSHRLAEILQEDIPSSRRGARELDPRNRVNVREALEDLQRKDPQVQPLTNPGDTPGGESFGVGQQLEREPGHPGGEYEHPRQGHPMPGTYRR